MERGCHLGTEGYVQIQFHPGNMPVKVVREQTMLKLRAKGGWGCYYGSPGGCFLCRLCYAPVMNSSYADVEENCPVSFMRLYDLMKRKRSVCAVGSAPRGDTSRAARAMCMLVNQQRPRSLDVLYVHNDFEHYTFLKADTKKSNGRHVVGIVELRGPKNRLSWGVVSRFVVNGHTVFEYDGQPPLNATKLCEQTSGPAATVCEYFSPTWQKRPTSIIPAVRLSGFDSELLNGVYVFAGYNSSVTARWQDTPYYESAKGGTLYVKDGAWSVRVDHCVIPLTCNDKPVWVPAHGQPGGQWVVYGRAGQKLPPAAPKCGPLAHDDEYCLWGKQLEALYDMKVLDALGVALGGCHNFDCQQLQRYPDAHRRMTGISNTSWVRLEISKLRRGADESWRDWNARAMVGDLIFVPKTWMERCPALTDAACSGFEIRVCDHTGRLLGVAKKVTPNVENIYFVILKFVKSTIRVDDTSSSKRKFDGAADRARDEPAKRSKFNTENSGSESAFSGGAGARSSEHSSSAAMATLPSHTAQSSGSAVFARQLLVYSLTLPTYNHSLQKGDQVRLVSPTKPVCWRTIESCDKVCVFLRDSLMPKPEEGTLVVDTWGRVVAIVFTTSPASPDKVYAYNLTSRRATEYLRSASFFRPTIDSEPEQSTVDKGPTHTPSALVLSGGKPGLESVDQLVRRKPLQTGAKSHTTYDASKTLTPADIAKGENNNELLSKGDDVEGLSPGTRLVDDSAASAEIATVRPEDDPGAERVNARQRERWRPPLLSPKDVLSSPSPTSSAVRSTQDGSGTAATSPRVNGSVAATETMSSPSEASARPEARVQPAKAAKPGLDADAARASLQLLVQVNLSSCLLHTLCTSCVCEVHMS